MTRTGAPNPSAAKRAMVRGARRVVALVDHTKIGQDHFVRFAEMKEVDVLVTDARIEAGIARGLEEAGVEVVYA